MIDQKRLGEFVPTEETEGKPFQADKYGNHRIVIKGKESRWHEKHEIATLNIDNKNGTADIFFAVTDDHSGVLPIGRVLKVVTVDEEGDSDYHQFKIVDLVEDKILGVDKTLNVLLESMLGRGCDDYDIDVKPSKCNNFVKIRVVKINTVDCKNLNRVLDRDGIIDYLVHNLDRYEFDIYDTDYVLINDCPVCDNCIGRESVLD